MTVDDRFSQEQREANSERHWGTAVAPGRPPGRP